MKKLTIVNKAQFGYHTDTFKYCEYLRREYAITYYCFDQGFDKILLEGIDVVYIPTTGGFSARGFRFLRNLRKRLPFQSDIAFVVDFHLCFLCRLLVRSNCYTMDIRTVSVSASKNKRRLQNASTRFNTLFFKNRTVISEGVARTIGIRKFTLLPLGADIISRAEKKVAALQLLYVGTFTNRRTYETIEGFADFVSRNPQTDAMYQLIGFGTPDEEQKIVETIEKYGLGNKVTFHGKRYHRQLVPFFDASTVGVSYVPMTEYYDHQPPTKTFEYLLSGLACIATATSENKRVINEQNGVLCSDTPAAFSEALEKLADRIHLFDPAAIRQQSAPYNWETILAQTLAGYLKRIVC